MEKIINNQGLQHLAEKVFLNLEHKDLEICAMINKSSQQILDNPIFWLKKFVSQGMSKKNEIEWSKAIKSVKKSDKKKHILSYLKWKLQMQEEIDIPFYTNSVVQRKFKEQISEAARKGDVEIVKILTPLTKSIKTSKKFIHDLIHMAIYGYGLAYGGHAEIIKFLAPLVKNPNALDKDGRTPINKASSLGHTEIVKILAPLSENPNAPNEDGWTPIHRAAFHGHTEIVKILAPLTDNPNAPNKNGETPIYKAAWWGHIEIVKILAPLSKNPNAPNKDGETPMQLLQFHQYSEEILNILKAYKTAKRTISEPSSTQSTKRPRNLPIIIE